MLYLGRQLDLPPTLFLPPPHREATDLEQEQRIRAYLQVQPFDATARERLTQWLTLRAQDGLPPQDLYQHAEAQLRAWQVLLPGPSTLERLIGTICAQTHQGLFEQLASRLSPELQHAFDALLQSRPGETQSHPRGVAAVSARSHRDSPQNVYRPLSPGARPGAGPARSQ